MRCVWRGEVVICGITDAPIPWPIAKLNGRWASLVVYRGLARALRTESNADVCRLWGVTPQTVSKWRKALRVRPNTPGTRKRRQVVGADPALVAARAEGQRSVSPEAKATRIEKIRKARLGKRRPPYVKRLMRLRRLGTKASPETRRKLSEDRKRRGVRPPKAGRSWSAAEDALLLQFPPAVVSQRTKRSLRAVYSRRDVLRRQGRDIPDERALRHARVTR